MECVTSTKYITIILPTPMKKILTLIFALVAVNTLTAAPQTTYKDTIDVVCRDLTLNPDLLGIFRMAYINANNDEYNLTGAIMEVDSIPPGKYTNCEMDLKHIVTGKKIAAKSVELVLTADKNRNCAIKGTMIGKNNILYNLDLSWTPPTPNKTVSISFDNSADVVYYPDLYHDFTLSNQNKEYEVSMDIANVPMGATFTEKNVVECFIVNKTANDTIKMATANGKVWQSNDTTYMTTSVVAFDSVQYNIDLWYAVPTPTQTVSLHFTNARFNNKIEKDGYFSLIGTTPDKSTEFAISLLSNSEEDISGIYINDGTFGEFTGKNYDFLNYITRQYATYIATNWNEKKQDYDNIATIEKGSASIIMDKNDNVSLLGSFISKDGIQYNITLTTKIDEPHFEKDMPSGSIDCVVIGTDTTLENNTQKDGTIFFDVFTNKELLALYFYAEEADPDIIIPEGTYNIDNSKDYYTVNTSDGTISTYPSFYATHDGNDFTSMYFFVSGTVVVKKINGKLYMEIDALNSYNVPAHIVYDGSISTDIENNVIKDRITTTKKIVNGQMMIIRNGKKYNVLGSSIE